MNQFDFNHDAFRTNLYNQGRKMADFNDQLIHYQLSGIKQAEKMMVNGVEQGMKMLEVSCDMQKAAWKSWLEMMAPKSETHKTEAPKA